MSNKKQEIEPKYDAVTVKNKVRMLIKYNAYQQLKDYLKKHVTLETFPTSLLNNMMLKHHRKVLISLVLPCYIDKLKKTSEDITDKVKALIINVTNAIKICDMEQTFDTERCYKALYQAIIFISQLDNENSRIYEKENEIFQQAKEDALIVTKTSQENLDDVATITVNEYGNICKLTHVGFRAILMYCEKNQDRKKLLLDDIPVKIINSYLEAGKKEAIFIFVFCLIQDNGLYTSEKHAEQARQIVNLFKKHKNLLIKAILEYALIYLDGDAQVDFLLDIYSNKKNNFIAKILHAHKSIFSIGEIEELKQLAANILIAIEYYLDDLAEQGNVEEGVKYIEELLKDVQTYPLNKLKFQSQEYTVTEKINHISRSFKSKYCQSIEKNNIVGCGMTVVQKSLEVSVNNRANHEKEFIKNVGLLVKLSNKKIDTLQDLSCCVFQIAEKFSGGFAEIFQYLDYLSQRENSVVIASIESAVHKYILNVCTIIKNMSMMANELKELNNLIVVLNSSFPPKAFSVKGADNLKQYQYNVFDILLKALDKSRFLRYEHNKTCYDAILKYFMMLEMIAKKGALRLDFDTCEFINDNQSQFLLAIDTYVRNKFNAADGLDFLLRIKFDYKNNTFCRIFHENGGFPEEQLKCIVQDYIRDNNIVHFDDGVQAQLKKLGVQVAYKKELEMTDMSSISGSSENNNSNVDGSNILNDGSFNSNFGFGGL